MPQPIAYLGFDGTCADAMRFYERVLGGKLERLITNAESPMAQQCAPGTGNRIMHARLALPDGGTLMGGDWPPEAGGGAIKGMCLSLTYDTVAEAERRFAALGEGGTIQMPMQPMFWAKRWGMLVDKFGTPWMVNGELLPH